MLLSSLQMHPPQNRGKQRDLIFLKEARGRRGGEPLEPKVLKDALLILHADCHTVMPLRQPLWWYESLMIYENRENLNNVS